MSLSPSGGALIRHDLNAFVEEAAAASSMFIGLKVAPAFSVDMPSGTYPVLKRTKGRLLHKASTIRAASGSYGRIQRTWETDTYDCVDRGLEEPIDDTVSRAVGPYFNAEVKAAELTLRNVMLDHEYRVASAVMNTSNFGSATNSTVAYTAANIATIDFPTDVLAGVNALQGRGENPDTIVVSSTVWTRLVNSTKLQNFCRGAVPSDATLAMTPERAAMAFAAEFGIKQILVGMAWYDTANEPQTVSTSSVWANTYIWVGNCGAGDLQTGGATRTLVWNKEGGTFVTETYREENIRSNIVRVRQNTTEKVINSNAGYLIATQYS